MVAGLRKGAAPSFARATPVLPITALLPPSGVDE
jgi:hypothetical protein